MVSPDYFSMFGVRMLRGRVFSSQEADEGAAVALVSAATARTLWPRADPIGQALELREEARTNARNDRRPSHTSVRVIGVIEDVASGLLIDGIDETCVYFATGFQAPGESRCSFAAAWITPR